MTKLLRADGKSSRFLWETNDRVPNSLAGWRRVGGADRGSGADQSWTALPRRVARWPRCYRGRSLIRSASTSGFRCPARFLEHGADRTLISGRASGSYTARGWFAGLADRSILKARRLSSLKRPSASVACKRPRCASPTPAARDLPCVLRSSSYCRTDPLPRRSDRHRTCPLAP